MGLHKVIITVKIRVYSIPLLGCSTCHECIQNRIKFRPVGGTTASMSMAVLVFKIVSCPPPPAKACLVKPDSYMDESMLEQPYKVQSSSSEHMLNVESRMAQVIYTVERD